MSDTQAVYEMADTWGYERLAQLRAQRNVAMGLAVTLLCCTLGATATVALLVPLKQVEPWVIEVDRVSGEVHVQTVLEQDQRLRALSGDVAVTEHELTAYVRARETFDRSDFIRNWQYVKSRSASGVFDAFNQQFEPASETDPRRLLNNRTRQVVMKSVQFIGNRAATVRFLTNVLRPDGSLETREDWIAIIQFAYQGDPKKVLERWDNPLGFVVTHYRLDQEVLPRKTTP